MTCQQDRTELKLVGLLKAYLYLLITKILLFVYINRYWDIMASTKLWISAIPSIYGDITNRC